METTKILTGTLIATAILNVASMKAVNSNLFGYTSLGTGSEVRAAVLNSTVSDVKFSDLCCGYNLKQDKKATRKQQRKIKKAKLAGLKQDKKAKDVTLKTRNKRDLSKTS